MKKRLLTLPLAATLICTPLWAGTAKDGHYYFSALKESMLEVFTENQKLFNAKPDGSVKNPQLTAEALYADSYNQFKKVGVGRDFNLKSLEGETKPEVIAPILTTMLQGGRDFIATQQDAFNTEPDGGKKPKKFIPAVFGRLTGEKFAAKTGLVLKQTTLGKGGYKERNPYNAPDAWEQAALAKVTAPTWKLNEGYGEVVGKEYRYLKPLYIKQGCLPCHGDPAGEMAAYGHAKEGYKLNEVRGGISIKIPMP